MRGLPRPVAAARAFQARQSLSRCRLCAFRCGVDRTRGPAGICATDAATRVFHEGIEWAGESALVPTYVVSLSGCNMACSFCLTGESSQNGRAGVPLDPDAVADRVRASASSIRSVTVLGGEPSIHLDGALEIAARIPEDLAFVWKTNATASEEGLALLEGVPDVVLADYKFGNDECAARLAGFPGYGEVVQENLRWAAQTSRLIVRHLAMPGHLDCCLAGVADWMARELPESPMSLMTGFLPVFRSGAELGRMNRSGDARKAVDLVRARGVRTVPWTLSPGPSPLRSPADDLWIDREGRICVDSATPELVELLKRLGGEFGLAS